MQGAGEHIPPSEMQKEPEDRTGPYVNAQARFYIRWGLVVNTEIAREIASLFQSSGYRGISFAHFASRGYISDNLLESIRVQMCYWLYESDGDDIDEMLDAIRNLYALQAYILKVEGKDKEKCECRCNKGRDCGGCGHSGCGYGEIGHHRRVAAEAAGMHIPGE